MDQQHDNAFNAGRLIQWGLKPKSRPAQEQEYRELIDIYLDRSDFRELVRSVARGLGLIILSVDEHGIVLGPESGSIFALQPANFRSATSRTYTDDRLIDGLVVMAIAASIFPKARDLEESAAIVRPPSSVDEVEETLRQFCDRFAEEARGTPDPSLPDEEKGLIDAWRVYSKVLAAMETRDSRKAPRTTRRFIETAFERLREFGCFTKETRENQVFYQPTYKYQVLVKELAAAYAFQKVQQLTADSE